MRTRPTQRARNAELVTRDQFLAKLAATLSASAAKLEKAASAGPELPAAVSGALLDHLSLVRELQIIASPSEPVPLRTRRHDICSWLAQFCEERQMRAAQLDLELTFERAGSIRSRFDADLLATMLEELLSNAMKYRRKRPVTVHAAQSGMSLSITVSNHGAWLGPRPTYERFQRGETRRSVEGYGVGLWLVRRLAEAHGGGFTIESDRTYTRAIIALPAAASRSKAAWFRATLLDRCPTTRRRSRGRRLAAGQ